jgi:hypothetical protein
MVKMAPLDKQQSALEALFGAIASRDRLTVAHSLGEDPALARIPAEAGATRAQAKSFYFDVIGHYAYAGDTALHIAAAAYAPDIADDLVSAGANVRARNRRGAQPLHYAADGNPGSRMWNPDAQFAIVQFLIKAGADPNSEDKSGVAPLHRAVRTRCAAAVRALLVNGANARMRNKGGSTALHLAVQNTGRGGSGSPEARDQQTQIIGLLLDHGARPSDKDSKGKSVRDCATSSWIQELLRGT